MSKIDFDAFARLLERYGLKQCWANILATRIAQRAVFSYILADPFFKDAVVLPEDILKGLSIGEIGILYEYGLSRQCMHRKKNEGIYFTPDDVAALMASYAKDFENGVWLDCCAGIGNLSWHLTNAQTDPEEFLAKRMVLSDKDALALKIAQVLFALSFQNRDKNLYFNIEKNFIQFDFLSVSDARDDLFNKDESLKKIPAHDYVIVNPPYLSCPADARFETAECADLYAYFLENIIKTSNGFISITPQSFTNAAKFKSLRSLMLRHFKNLRIYNFDNIPGNIFSGIKFGSQNSNHVNSIRAAITVAGVQGDGRKITSLLRWKSQERQEFFKNLDDFLSDVPLKADFFPKVGHCLASFYKQVSGHKKLGSLLSSRETPYRLYVPSCPRYFISALKTAADRASQKVLYFKSLEDMDKAYLLLNSSYMYWWWRVRDGGMTLSLRTLESLPLIDIKPNEELTADLEASEKANKVYKLNAGKMQENVKHPFDLIQSVTEYVAPLNSAFLCATHSNSDLHYPTRLTKSAI